MAVVTSWFRASEPAADGSRRIVEHHVVNGEHRIFEWTCHRRIDPQSEVNRRAADISREAPGDVLVNGQLR